MSGLFLRSLPGRAAAWAVVTALALGCSDSAGPEPVDPGAFRATLSGGATGSFAGVASHRQVDSWQFFSILLEHVPDGEPDETPDPQIILEHVGGQPGVGTYTVVTGTGTEPPTPTASEMALFMYMPHGGALERLDFDPEHVSGTVRIDVATDLEYAGTITVEGPAHWDDGSSAGTVRLSAEFRSEPFDWSRRMQRDGRRAATPAATTRRLSP